MTETASTPTVPLDPTAAQWLDSYRQADENEKKWAEVKARARAQLEAILGDAEIGTVDDRPAVRWTFVPARRLDQKKLKEQAPEVYEQCLVQSVNRRFTIVEDANL